MTDWTSRPWEPPTQDAFEAAIHRAVEDWARMTADLSVRGLTRLLASVTMPDNGGVPRIPEHTTAKHRQVIAAFVALSYLAPGDSPSDRWEYTRRLAEYRATYVLRY